MNLDNPIHLVMATTDTDTKAVSLYWFRIFRKQHHRILMIKAVI